MQPYTGPSVALESVILNWAALNNCLILESDSAGLSVSVFFPFTLAFPPLLIPWTEILATPKQSIFAPVIAFQFSLAPKVSWSMMERSEQELLAAQPAAEAQEDK